MKEFIIERIKEMTKKFPEIKASYYFDDFDDGNFIHILPITHYRNNKEYKDFETKTIFSFVDQFLYESIAFVSEETVVDLLDMELVYTSIGKEYSGKKNNKGKNSKEYIMDKIKKITDKFPKIKASYYFNYYDWKYYIKISPFDEYQNNTEYINFEDKIKTSFFKNFDLGSLTFISDKSKIDLSSMNIIHETSGKLYKA